jgi:hypothetical protein
MATPNKPTLHVNRQYRKTFDQIPVRGTFSFDQATPYKAFGGGLYVKTGTRTFAAPAVGPRPRGKGDPVTNTGKVKFWVNPINKIDTVARRVVELNPSFVHQEQDKVAW